MIKNSMIVDILGTDYQIIFTDQNKYSGLRNRRGCCDPSSKVIAIIDDWDSGSYYCLENIPDMVKKTLRHEIVHAFLYESGIENLGEYEEIIVDWIAIQFPKLLEVFDVAEAI